MMTRPKISRILDILIGLIFFLFLYILISGGFQFFVLGMKISATFPGKPGLILVGMFFFKVLIADYRKDIEKKKILLYSTFLLIFAAGEGISRIAYSELSRNDLRWASQHLTISKNVTPSNLRLFDMIKISNNKRIVYELLPRVSGKFMGASIKINGQGFRDSKDIKKKKPESEFRIVGLGDSNMFGWAVEFPQTLGEILESRLNLRAKKGKYFRFINTGVPGYNTTMEAETFVEKSPSVHPDMVVIFFDGNDTGLPNFLMKKENPWLSTKSFFFFQITKTLKIFANRSLNLYTLERISQDKKENLKGVREEYRFMVGKIAFRSQMKRLKDKADDLKLPMVMLILGFGPSTSLFKYFPVQVARKLGIPYLMAYDNFAAYLKKHRLTREDLFISKSDRHPSIHGHRLIAQNLTSLITSQAFLSLPHARKLSGFIESPER